MAKKTGKSKKGKNGKGTKDKKAKKPKNKAASLVPTQVSTGKGASVGEVATQFVQMFKAAPANEAAIWDALFHKKFSSTEGGLCWQGRKAVEAKAADFNAKHEVHACTCEGPYVGTNAFGVKYVVDMTVRATGQKLQMAELAHYRLAA